MTDQAAWLEHFASVQAARIEEYRAAREGHWATIAAKLAPPEPVVRPAPVVLARGHSVESEDPCVPAAARRAHSLALACGWEAQLVASLAVDPARGLLSVVTVRFRRHDERGFCAWWNGGYDFGCYLQVGSGLELLVGTPMEQRVKARATAAAKTGVPAAPVATRGYADVLKGIQAPRVDLESGTRVGHD